MSNAAITGQTTSMSGRNGTNQAVFLLSSLFLFTWGTYSAVTTWTGSQVSATYSPLAGVAAMILGGFGLVHLTLSSLATTRVTRQAITIRYPLGSRTVDLTGISSVEAYLAAGGHSPLDRLTLLLRSGEHPGPAEEISFSHSNRFVLYQGIVEAAYLNNPAVSLAPLVTEALGRPPYGVFAASAALPPAPVVVHEVTLTNWLESIARKVAREVGPAEAARLEECLSEQLTLQQVLERARSELLLLEREPLRASTLREARQLLAWLDDPSGRDAAPWNVREYRRLSHPSPAAQAWHALGDGLALGLLLLAALAGTPSGGRLARLPVLLAMLALYRHAMLVRREGVQRDPRWIALTILVGVAFLFLWLSVF